VEVSSFQLEGIVTFRPRVAVFLNVSPDHLDRHASFEAYLGAKSRIFENQGADDWAVVNADDPLTLEAARRGKARLPPFRTSGEPLDGDGAFFAAGEAQLRLGTATDRLFSAADVSLPGAHLKGDLLVAAAVARLLGADTSAIARAAASFHGVEHVLER